MRPFHDPSELTPDERRRELTAIFAAGLLRLRRRRLQAGESLAPPEQNASNSAAPGLEFGQETVLSVHSG